MKLANIMSSLFTGSMVEGIAAIADWCEKSIKKCVRGRVRNREK